MSARKLTFAVALLTLSGCLQDDLQNSSLRSGLHNSDKVFTDPSDMRQSDWSDPAEMERAWQAALVRIPKSSGGYVSTTIAELDGNGVSPEGVWPTVIYLHGCTGIWSGTKTRINFLARNGYAVVAPASLARLKYPQSCRSDTHQGGLYRPTLKMRQYDAGHAIAKAKTLPWVDNSNVFLMGLSQGGITTATFSSTNREHSLRARIVEGWTCHAGWNEYAGINAPESEPVLTLVGDKDPWFQNHWNKGSCGRFLSDSNGSRSVVYSEGRLSTRHELLETQEVQQTVLEFLRSQRSRWLCCSPVGPSVHPEGKTSSFPDNRRLSIREFT